MGFYFVENVLYIDGLVVVDIEFNFYVVKFFYQYGNVEVVGVVICQVGIVDEVVNFFCYLLKGRFVGDIFWGDFVDFYCFFVDWDVWVDEYVQFLRFVVFFGVFDYCDLYNLVFDYVKFSGF